MESRIYHYLLRVSSEDDYESRPVTCVYFGCKFQSVAAEMCHLFHFWDSGNMATKTLMPKHKFVSKALN